MAKLNEYTSPELVRMLGRRFKEYRLRCNMTQKEVAYQSGLTVATIHKFETGTAKNISLWTFISLLRALGILDFLDNVLPELPESPYLYKKEHKIQRIRHKTND